VTLQIVPPQTEREVEHKPVCSIDGEPWPCAHNQREAHFAAVQRYSVLCLACGKSRNACVSLEIRKGLDGRTVYFHYRKRCRPKARDWWDENVRPHTGEPFRECQWIDDLARYIAARNPLQVAAPPRA
jgi:hypothetical protein